MTGWASLVPLREWISLYETPQRLAVLRRTGAQFKQESLRGFFVSANYMHESFQLAPLMFLGLQHLEQKVLSGLVAFFGSTLLKVVR